MTDRPAEIARALINSPIRGFTHGRILRGIGQNLGGGLRRELAERLNVSTATVTRAVSIMKGLELVQEGRQQQGGPGRPVGPLSLTQAFAMLGIAVTARGGRPGALVGTVLYLDGSPVAASGVVRTHELTEAAQSDPDSLVGELREFAVDLQREAGIPTRALLGCGVSVAGYVDTAGVVRRAYGRTWSPGDRLNLGERLSGELGLPVVVGNDISSLAVRKNLRPSQPSDNYALLAPVDVGVGGALVVNGRMWSGQHNMAGEPGHLPTPSTARVTRLPDDTPDAQPVELSMPRCQCEAAPAGPAAATEAGEIDHEAGFAGHVEAFASPHALERRALDNGIVTTPTAVGELAARPRADRPTSLLFYQGGLALGSAVVSVLNWFDPARVVIYLTAEELHVTNRYLAGGYYLTGLWDRVRRHALHDDDLGEVVQVRSLRAGEMEQRLASSAAYLVLRRLVRLITEDDELPAQQDPDEQPPDGQVSAAG